jgi:ABC-2 type transport system ATP-binding protein
MVEVRQLRKAYGSLQAVDGISFEILPHETFGLLGPNGAGKTTTLHMLVGLLRPDSGEIHINGCPDPGRPGVRQGIGVAPQALSLYEELTATENLRFFGRLYGLRGRDLAARVRAGLERAELVDRARHQVRTYSGGMKRRLHLACALLHDPQVLLLDEPTIGVDPQARHHILDDIQRLKDQGCTTILTTHYIEEAERLCDRVAIMDHGRILAMDTVSNMIRRYGSRAIVQAELEHVPDDAPALPGAVRGRTLTFESDHPFEALKNLAAAGIVLRNLAIERPSLETVFLNLTGRRLRD